MYTTSKLATAAGVSVHIVRDYVVHGLVHPMRRTPGDHGLYDHRTLARLLFVRVLFKAGIGLDELASLCKAWTRTAMPPRFRPACACTGGTSSPVGSG